MNYQQYLQHWLPVLILLIPLVTSLILLFILKNFPRIQGALDILGSISRFLLAGFAWWTFPTLSFQFKVSAVPLLWLDELSAPFLLLFSTLWLIITIYMYGYVQDPIRRNRFLAFAGLSATASTGMIISANLLVSLIFYELLALVVYALITLEDTAEQRKVGQVYLRYMTLGSVTLFIAIIGLMLTGEYTIIWKNITLNTLQQPFVLLLLVGFSIQAVLFPFQRWLIQMTITPFPVVMLLCTFIGLQIGIFNLLKITYFYEEFHILLIAIAIVTFLYSAKCAITENMLLKRMIFIAINQSAYTIMIALLILHFSNIMELFYLYQNAFLSYFIQYLPFYKRGCAECFTAFKTITASQSTLTVLLFLCIGNLMKVLGLQKISDMQGVGRQMPATMAMFTLASLSIILLAVLSTTILPLFLIGGFIIPLLMIVYFFPLLYKSWSKKATGKRYLLVPLTTLLAPWLAVVLLMATIAVFFISIL